MKKKENNNKSVHVMQDVIEGAQTLNKNVLLKAVQNGREGAM